MTGVDLTVPGEGNPCGEREHRGPLGALLRDLASEARNSTSLERHVRAFSAWITAAEVGDSPAGTVLSDLAADAITRRGAARTYRDVSILGYAAGLDRLSTQGLAVLLDGLRWLAGREWFIAGRPPSLEADPIALLGLAVGLRALPVDAAEELTCDWLTPLVARARPSAADPWEDGLFAAGEVIAGAPNDDGSAARNLIDSAPDLAAALASRGLLTLSQHAQDAAFHVIATNGFDAQGADRAAARLTALRWLLRSAAVARPAQATVEDTINLLEGVKRSLRRWCWEDSARTRGGVAVQWPINNEYQVQDLLWVILAPVFPDLEDEESLPSIGQKHPRVDLLIPSLRLIIEVKFIRTGTKREFSETIGQVSEDTGLYLTQRSGYDKIIAFMWDNSRHSEEHDECRQGLLQLAGVAGAIIVSRPGKMTTSAVVAALSTQ